MALPLIGSLIPILEQVLNRVIPDPEERARLQIQLAELADREAARESQQLIAQSEVNKVEAGHRSIFVAGWRPFVGWGCGAALIYNTMIAPMFGLGVADLGFLQTILLGMLGLASARTLEKIKGVAESTIGVVAPNEPILQAPKKKKKILGIAKWPF